MVSSADAEWWSEAVSETDLTVGFDRIIISLPSRFLVGAYIMLLDTLTAANVNISVKVGHHMNLELGFLKM